MISEGEVLDFEGKVLRRDADGFGIVEISKFPDDLPASGAQFGVFTREVLQDPEVAESCKVGSRVTGSAQVSEYGAVRVMRLEKTI